jgi:hypothetical protein
MDPGARPDGEELAAMQEQLAEARAEVERLQREAANAVAEAAFLRDDVRMSNEAVSAANAEATGLREELDAAARRAQAAAERYRDLVVRTEPALPSDLIAGADADAIDASVTAARAVLQRVREGMARHYDVPPVPAGAPARSSPDLSALTPEQKIRHGLGAGGGGGGWMLEIGGWRLEAGDSGARPARECDPDGRSVPTVCPSPGVVAIRADRCVRPVPQPLPTNRPPTTRAQQVAPLPLPRALTANERPTASGQ